MTKVYILEISISASLPAVFPQYDTSSWKERFILAKSGSVFAGLSKKILKPVPIEGVNFFTIQSNIEYPIPLPEEVLSNYFSGMETLEAVKNKLDRFLSKENKVKSETAKESAVKSDPKPSIKTDEGSKTDPEPVAKTDESSKTNK